jgi:hypothetical protein
MLKLGRRPDGEGAATIWMGDRPINWVLCLALLVAGVLFFVLSMLFGVALWKARGHLELAQQRVFLDAYKAIGAGFLVAVLGFVIPQLLPQARDYFERFKESRNAYSEAKTSVMYLPETIASLKFDGALKAIRGAHEKLHRAETYRDQLKQHLVWYPHPATWVDRNFWELFAIRVALRSNIEDWDEKLKPGERLEVVRKMLRIVEASFGPDNENWVPLMPLSERARKRKHEEELEKALENSAKAKSAASA